MRSGTERRKSAREWQMFLEEVRCTALGQVADLSGVADADDLARRFQAGAGLSSKRSKQEVDHLLCNFEERIQRAA